MPPVCACCPVLCSLVCPTGCRPHSIQSLIGEVQRGEMQPAEFVATVAAGRARPLLRPATRAGSGST